MARAQMNKRNERELKSYVILLALSIDNSRLPPLPKEMLQRLNLGLILFFPARPIGHRLRGRKRRIKLFVAEWKREQQIEEILSLASFETGASIIDFSARTQRCAATRWRSKEANAFIMHRLLCPFDLSMA